MGAFLPSCEMKALAGSVWHFEISKFRFGVWMCWPCFRTMIRCLPATCEIDRFSGCSDESSFCIDRLIANMYIYLYIWVMQLWRWKYPPEQNNKVVFVVAECFCWSSQLTALSRTFKSSSQCFWSSQMSSKLARAHLHLAWLSRGSYTSLQQQLLWPKGL